jgi:hypothetical protein
VAKHAVNRLKNNWVCGRIFEISRVNTKDFHLPYLTKNYLSDA